MESKELSYEEANKLFQSALLIISQQNLAEKQKGQKSKNQFPHLSPSSSPKSPKKIRNKETMLQNFELAPLEGEPNPEKSPQRTINGTLQNVLADRWGSQRELSESSPLGTGKPSQKQDNSFGLSDLRIESPMKVERKEMEIEEQFVLQMGGMREEKEQDLYLQGEIKQIKRDLQIRSRGKICKTQEINSTTGQVVGYHFYCKNDSECSFDCYLQYANKRNSRGEKFYKLTTKSQTHLNACLEDDQEIAFMKLTKTIDNMEEPIIKLLSQNGELKPKQILTRMAQKLGEQNHKFIYKGLISKNYHKAAKKYFDNLIYKVKNSMGVLPQ